MKNFLKTIGSNRRILNQRLFIDFKKPWNYLHPVRDLLVLSAQSDLIISNGVYFLPAEARAPSPAPEQVRCGVNSARGEDERNRLMWTRWESNPRSPLCKRGILPLNYGPKNHFSKPPVTQSNSSCQKSLKLFTLFGIKRD